ncbi:multiheme c-type cytochrome [uncultured Desulfuromonas sp.]|uniref:multiheme c-type cytochrome n=1 Tax=uncultured Desulfuromonas sp. TaxID=181013 RepID=UPI002AAB9361|nr:multiheme c-type cytochrome [uncultured Desulfuromonas sp.]
MQQLVADYGSDRTLRLNAGNMFKRDGELEKKRAEVILTAYAAMAYDVYAIGPFDATFGLSSLETMAAAVGVTPICSNLIEGAAQSIAPYQLVEKGGQRILVTSLVDPWLSDVVKKKKGISLPVCPVEGVLSPLFESVPHDVSIVVVQTATTHLEDLLSGIGVKPDLVVLGYQEGVIPPKTLDNGLTYVANNLSGKVLASVDFVAGEKPLDLDNWQHVTLSMADVVPEPKVDQLITSQEQWEKDFHRRKRKSNKINVGRGPSNFYLGDGWCVRCHPEISRSWKQSRHAHALATLQNKGRADDPRCLPCHVTGMKQNNEESLVEEQRMGGGFTSLEMTPHLGNVQCEACHGPGKLHARNPKLNPLRKGDDTVCQRCHTEDTSPGFVYRENEVH